MTFIFEPVTFSEAEQLPDNSGAVPWLSWPFFQPVTFAELQTRLAYAGPRTWS